LGDAFRILNVSYERKMNFVRWQREEQDRRIYTGRTSKMSFGGDRNKVREEKLKERFEFEKGRTGGYELIYPAPGETPESKEKNKRYEAYIKKANDLWDEFTTGRKTLKDEKFEFTDDRNNK